MSKILGVKKNSFPIFLIIGNSLLILSLLILYLFVGNSPTPKKIFSETIKSIVEVKASLDTGSNSYGTGILINKDGSFITNAHVVTYSSKNITNEFDNYYVRFSFEEDYRQVSLFKYDIELDLAILKLDILPDFKLKSIKFGNSNDLKSGEIVYALGNSQNFGISMSSGLVGIPLINVEYDNISRSVIQCDLTIAGGNSGGALLNKKGELVGITTFRTKDSSGNVIYGIAYSIPINIGKTYITNSQNSAE
jgi:S1-C subfamily serine protease